MIMIIKDTFTLSSARVVVVKKKETEKMSVEILYKASP